MRVNPRIVTLLTDFGEDDGYVGAMKGVILSLAPRATVVDLSHSVPPQDVRRGGLIWRRAAPHFPPGSVHIGVVDPGVGTRRRLVAVETRDAVFLAPDNGLVSYAMERRDVRCVRHIRNRRYFRPAVSQTFHGRDILAPVAAHLSAGESLESVGPRLDACCWTGVPRPRKRRRGRVVELQGEVIDIDRFGNVTSNLKVPPEGERVEFECAGRVFSKLSPSYSAVRAGAALTIVGSLGFVEVAVRCGSAAAQLGLEIGDPFIGRWQLP